MEAMKLYQLAQRLRDGRLGVEAARARYEAMQPDLSAVESDEEER